MKKGIRAGLMQKMELPLDMLGGSSAVTVSGGCELYASGCTGILKYEEDEIILRLSDGELHIRGKKFVMHSFGNGNIKIKGKICGVDLV